MKKIILTRNLPILIIIFFLLFCFFGKVYGEITVAGSTSIAQNNNSQNNSKPASSPSTNKSPVKIDANKALDELVGLTSVKRELKRIKAYAVKNKDKNINIHMAFLGNPGTGKTEVARLIGQILFEAGVLKNTNFVEC